MWLKMRTSIENEAAVVSPRVSVLPGQCSPVLGKYEAEEGEVRRV